jgi:hypothetical protein
MVRVRLGAAHPAQTTLSLGCVLLDAPCSSSLASFTMLSVCHAHRRQGCGQGCQKEQWLLDTRRLQHTCALKQLQQLPSVCAPPKKKKKKKTTNNRPCTLQASTPPPLSVLPTEPGTLAIRRCAAGPCLHARVLAQVCRHSLASLQGAAGEHNARARHRQSTDGLCANTRVACAGTPVHY